MSRFISNLRNTSIIGKDDHSRAERPRRRLGLATAVASAAVVGGVMVPAVAASAAPMHQPAAVTMAPRHDHHHDGDDWDHWDPWEPHHHWVYFWDWDHDCWD